MTDPSMPSGLADVSDEIATDVLFDALADERRRAVLVALARENGQVELDELARTLAARSADDEPGESVRRRLVISLYHHHAPKLDDAGLVEFDPEAGTITPLEAGTDVGATLREDRQTQ